MQDYVEADPSGIFCMEEAGDVVAIIGSMRWSCEYASIAFFIVEASMRGKGVGKQMWERAMQHVEGVRTVGLFAVREKVPMYQKWGFVINASIVTCKGPFDLGGLGSAECDARVCDYAQVPWNKIVEYDSIHFACARPNLLEALLKHKGAMSVVAASPAGDLIGLGRVRVVLDADGSKRHRVSPLFAESPQVARAILAALCGGLNGETVQIDFPEENKEAMELARSVGLKESPSCVFMHKGSAPLHPARNIFSYSNMEFG